jgi:hypothetical protein
MYQMKNYLIHKYLIDKYKKDDIITINKHVILKC